MNVAEVVAAKVAQQLDAHDAKSRQRVERLQKALALAGEQIVALHNARKGAARLEHLKPVLDALQAHAKLIDGLRADVKKLKADVNREQQP